MKPLIFLARASIEKEIALGDSLAAAFERTVTVVPDARVERIGAALAPLPVPENPVMSAYPLPAQRIEAAQKAIAALHVQ